MMSSGATQARARVDLIVASVARLRSERVASSTVGPAVWRLAGAVISVCMVVVSSAGGVCAVVRISGERALRREYILRKRMQLFTNGAGL